MDLTDNQKIDHMRKILTQVLYTIKRLYGDGIRTLSDTQLYNATMTEITTYIMQEVPRNPDIPTYMTAEDIIKLLEIAEEFLNGEVFESIDKWGFFTKSKKEIKKLVAQYTILMDID